MNRHTWQLGDGRAIIRDGVRVTNLQSRFKPDQGYAMPPAELDKLARRVVGLLETMEPAPGWTIHENAEMIARGLRMLAKSRGDIYADERAMCADLAARFDALSNADYFANLETSNA